MMESFSRNYNRFGRVLAPGGIYRDRACRVDQIQTAPSLFAFCYNGESRKLITQINSFQESFRSRNEVSLIYLADEFYLKARYPFPSHKEYDGFPQLENGIGMARLFYEDFRKLSPLLTRKAKRLCHIVLATSQDGAKVLYPVVKRLQLIKN